MSSALELSSGMFVKNLDRKTSFFAFLTLKGTPNVVLLGKEKADIKRLIDFTLHFYNSEETGYLVLKKIYLHVRMGRQDAMNSEQFQVSGQSTSKVIESSQLTKGTKQLGSSAASETPGGIIEHHPLFFQSPKLLS